MILAHWIVIALWFILIVLWLIGATMAKRTINRGRLRQEILIRLVIVALLVIILRNPTWRHALVSWQNNHSASVLVAWIGVALCAIGVALATAARIQLGRNWGMPATVKENPELITTGPYRVIRHPIYTGILLAALGSALAEGLFWIIIFVAASIYFFLMARQEERLMLQQFPEQYPAYMKGTKMLIPLIL
ncbi:MAG TPA: isoprenylcysteine carboxylmethyltransferase family protein [Gemmatimonadaceae bacterium]|nr:isoprenylcysteine carboxylmethyltransferase family protein [Gemmatimonadaceae bacterium]